MKTAQSLSVKALEEISPVERATPPSEAAHIIVCFTSLAKGLPAGELFNAYLPETVPFAGLGDLILKMDRIYDYFDFPQSDREPRTFAGKNRQSCDRPAADEPRYYQRYPTKIPRRTKLILEVHTRFRQHGSWQGTVRCLSTKQTSNYISALQFLKLAAEAVEASFDVAD